MVVTIWGQNPMVDLAQSGAMGVETQGAAMGRDLAWPTIAFSPQRCTRPLCVWEPFRIRLLVCSDWVLCVLCVQGRTGNGPVRPHTSMADLCCSAFLLLGLVLGLLWLMGEPRRLGSCREGLAAPDGTAHGPELMSWTLGAWQVRGRSGPGSLLHLRKVHWTS